MQHNTSLLACQDAEASLATLISGDMTKAYLQELQVVTARVQQAKQLSIRQQHIEATLDMICGDTAKAHVQELQVVTAMDQQAKQSSIRQQHVEATLDMIC